MIPKLKKLANAFRDLDISKFTTKKGDDTIAAVRVVNVQGEDGGGISLQLGVDYDNIDITYPASNKERYEYSLLSTIVQTIEVTYTNATKDIITNVAVI